MSAAGPARKPRLGGRHYEVLAGLPRDGRAVPALAEGRGNREERWLCDLAAWGLTILWPGRGWAITETGVRVIEAERREPTRRRSAAR